MGIPVVLPRVSLVPLLSLTILLFSISQQHILVSLVLKTTAERAGTIIRCPADFGSLRSKRSCHESVCQPRILVQLNCILTCDSCIIRLLMILILYIIALRSSRNTTSLALFMSSIHTSPVTESLERGILHVIVQDTLAFTSYITHSSVRAMETANNRQSQQYITRHGC